MRVKKKGFLVADWDKSISTHIYTKKYGIVVFIGVFMILNLQILQIKKKLN